MKRNRLENGALPIINLLVSVVFVLASGLTAQYAQPSDEIIAPQVNDIPADNEVKLPTGFTLPEAPDQIKSVYLTGGSSGRKSYIDYVIELARTTQVNAVVIDIKDYEGHILYNTSNSIAPLVKEYGAKKIAIADIDSVIKRLHNSGVYVIARIVVFQDSVLARARPDLAVLRGYKPLDDVSLPAFWEDRAGLLWVDPAAEDVWEYNIAIAKDAASHGFDEINFDYVRFPSDGDLKNIVYPFWNGQAPRHIAIRNFFQRLRQELPNQVLSVDLFGLATVNRDDLGVGQIIEDAFAYFDFVCPMVYPSHYAKGFLKYDNPADYPYEVVAYSMSHGMKRLEAFRQQESSRASYLRPWLQDFDLKAEYTADMVGLEIKAVFDALGSEDFKGFMLWNAANIYTADALEGK